VVSLGGVVVDHIQKDFDPGVVHDLDITLEIPDRATGEVRRIRREEADAVVAPEIGEALIHQHPVAHESVNRQQLHGGHPQLRDVVHHFRVGKAGKGTPDFLWYGGIQHRVTTGVKFVDDSAIPGGHRFGALAPGERRVDYLALRYEGSAVSCVEGEVGFLRSDDVAEEGVVPDQGAFEGTRRRIVGAVHAVSVQLPRSDVRQVAVPDLMGIFRKRYPGDLLVAVFVEEAEIHPFRVSGEEGEVGSTAVPGCSQGIRSARPEPVCLMFRHSCVPPYCISGPVTIGALARISAAVNAGEEPRRSRACARGAWHAR